MFLRPAMTVTPVRVYSVPAGLHDAAARPGRDQHPLQARQVGPEERVRLRHQWPALLPRGVRQAAAGLGHGRAGRAGGHRGAARHHPGEAAGGPDRAGGGAAAGGEGEVTELPCTTRNCIIGDHEGK